MQKQENLKIPRVFDGPHGLSQWFSAIRAYGHQVLWFTGRQAFDSSPWGEKFKLAANRAGLEVLWVQVEGEPSPSFVDGQVQHIQQHEQELPQVVVATGGGSVIDAAKAVAALLPSGESCMEFLEGVGKGRAFTGPTVPFFAAPTTAGSGAEATMNAVLSSHGANPFKKSFRHPLLIAEGVLLDPEVLSTCPRSWAIADGMDARVQLIESYLSPRATDFTMRCVERYLPGTVAALERWARGEETSLDRWTMQRAAFVSGIVLARTGLGAVHGLAAPLGAIAQVPHAVACANLLDPVMQETFRTASEMSDRKTLSRLDRLARLDGISKGSPLKWWIEQLQSQRKRWEIPRLSSYGVGVEQLQWTVQQSGGHSMQTHPVPLSDNQLAGIVRSRL